MNNKNKTLTTTKFYSEPVRAEELHSGFLTKSPPTSPLTKGFLKQKSWKRRFFVLRRMGEDNYNLTYYTNEKREKSMGEIDISNISSLSTNPESYQMWDWIQKHFKCPASSVLFMRVATRDYFLLGQSSEDVDAWRNAISDALQKLPNEQQITEVTPRDHRIRSISAPLACSEPMIEEQPPERWSAPQPDHYDYPRKLSEPPTLPANMVQKYLQSYMQCTAKEDRDENDEEEEEEDEAEDSEYMCMSSVQTALEDDQKEEDTVFTQTNTCINGHVSPVCNGEVSHKDDENKRMSTDETISEPLVNGKRASTELDGALLHESETRTHVEKDICISQKSLKNSLVLTEEEGKPCVSECREIQDSCLLLKGDQILAFNDLLIDTVEEIQTYLRRLSKDEVKLTIRRPLNLETCPSH